MGSLPLKKAAAIAAAVLQHVCEADSLGAAPPAPPAGEAGIREFPSWQLWAWGGRQQAMQDRVAWQRRLGKC